MSNIRDLDRIVINVSALRGAQGDKGDPAGGGNVVTTRTALAGVQATQGDAWYLSEGSRSGTFAWDPAVPVATHQADPLQGVYVARNAAQPGAWVRQGVDAILPHFFGAKADGRRLEDVAVTAGSPVITSATAVFSAADVGRWAFLWILAGSYKNGSLFTARIASVQSATQATLAGAAPDAGRIGCLAYVGSDDHDAVDAANAYLKGRGGGTLDFGPGVTMYRGPAPLQPWSDIRYTSTGGGTFVSNGNCFQTAGISTQHAGGVAGNYVFRPIADITADAAQFVCATPAHAAEFLVGRLAWLRATATVDYGGGGKLPRYNEINRIVSADPVTGIVKLEKPVRDGWSGLTACMLPETVPQRMQIDNLRLVPGYMWYFGEGHYECSFENLQIEGYHAWAVNGHCHSIVRNVRGTIWYTGASGQGGRVAETKLASRAGTVADFVIAVRNVSGELTRMTTPIVDQGEYCRDVHYRDIHFDAATCNGFQGFTDYRALRSKVTDCSGVLKSAEFGFSISHDFTEAEAPYARRIGLVYANTTLTLVDGWTRGAINLGSIGGAVISDIDIRGAKVIGSPQGTAPGVQLFGLTERVRLGADMSLGRPAISGTHSLCTADNGLVVDVLNQTFIDAFEPTRTKRTANGGLKRFAQFRALSIDGASDASRAKATTAYNPAVSLTLPPNTHLRNGDRILLSARGISSNDAIVKYVSVIFETSPDGVTWTRTQGTGFQKIFAVAGSTGVYAMDAEIVIASAAGGGDDRITGLASFLNTSWGTTAENGAASATPGALGGYWVDNTVDLMKYTRVSIALWLASAIDASQYIRVSRGSAQLIYLEESAR